MQGVDWRDKQNWGCNAGMNPYLEHMNDGISLVKAWNTRTMLLEHSSLPATRGRKMITELDSLGTLCAYRIRWRWCLSR